MKKERCPHCAVSLQGAEIPEDSRHHFEGGATHFGRQILIEVSGIYDGGLYYQCPDCGGAWHRHKVGNPLRAVAEPYIQYANRFKDK